MNQLRAQDEQQAQHLADAEVTFATNLDQNELCLALGIARDYPGGEAGGGQGVRRVRKSG